jgi:uncharacterized protein (DUF1501 family)
MTSPRHDLSRRQFVGACCATVGAVGLLSTLAQLRAIGAVVGSGSGTVRSTDDRSNYKALVCLFLAGGNDANNFLVPIETADYAAYASARSALALPKETLLPIHPRNGDGRGFGLHPSLRELQGLFDDGQMSLLANVGTLVVPTTKEQFKARSVPLPNSLFSHNDQQVQWQSSIPDSKLFTTGWGGRLADLTNAFNENNAISMSISLAGQNAFQVGKQVVQYAVSPRGAVQPAGFNGPLGAIRAQAHRDLLDAGNGNLFAAAFGGLTHEAIEDSHTLAVALKSEPTLATPFPKSNLGTQLQMIARLIAVAPTLGLRRQIFFARLGGWDLHDAQIDAHAKLLADVSQSVAAFYQATRELGVADRVTTFTASDFGRTYTSNGHGSDHGWGSHHFIVGGAVKGGQIYGRMPDLSVGGPDDTGRGRWIPTTSVDEYSATLATWFGVSATDLPAVLPNIGRFARRDLGFLG